MTRIRLKYASKIVFPVICYRTFSFNSKTSRDQNLLIFLIILLLKLILCQINLFYDIFKYIWHLKQIFTNNIVVYLKLLFYRKLPPFADIGRSWLGQGFLKFKCLYVVQKCNIVQWQTIRAVVCNNDQDKLLAVSVIHNIEIQWMIIHKYTEFMPSIWIRKRQLLFWFFFIWTSNIYIISSLYRKKYHVCWL